MWRYWRDQIKDDSKILIMAGLPFPRGLCVLTGGTMPLVEIKLAQPLTLLIEDKS